MNVQEACKPWLDAFSLTPEGYDAEAAQRALAAWCAARGKGEKAYIVANRKEAKALINRVAPEQAKDAHKCIWDYYLMAFFEAGGKVAKKRHEFTDNSLFDCFKAGMFHLVMLNGHQIGIMRPKQVFRGMGNRLHNAKGPAIVYDDASLNEYYFEGTRVPKHYIEGKPTVKDALEEPNLEVRRVAVAILGWEAVLQEVKAKSIAKHDNPYIGELVECEISGERRRFLRVQCGTGRMFAMSVDPTVETPMEAQAWIADMSLEEYEAEYAKGYSRT